MPPKPAEFAAPAPSRHGRQPGLHLTADLHGCRAATLMTDAGALRDACLRAVAAAQLNGVGELFHRFPPPGGVTGVVLLAESHLAVHTWPEQRLVTLDAFVCNLQHDNRERAQALMRGLEDLFAAADIRRQRIERSVA